MSGGNELREALHNIANTCSRSHSYSRRIQSIHNTAMVALGMTFSQRQERHKEAALYAQNHIQEFRDRKFPDGADKES